MFEKNAIALLQFSQKAASSNSLVVRTGSLWGSVNKSLQVCYFLPFR